MKHLFILLFLLQSFLGISQNEKTTILPTPESKTFTWKNGEGKYVDVSFSYLIPVEKKLEKELMDNIVMNIMIKSKFKLKNKYSYIPLKLTLMYSDKDDKYSGICKYVGKNGYGVESESTTYFNFTLDGEITEIGTM